MLHEMVKYFNLKNNLSPKKYFYEQYSLWHS